MAIVPYKKTKVKTFNNFCLNYGINYGIDKRQISNAFQIIETELKNLVWIIRNSHFF